MQRHSAVLSDPDTRAELAARSGTEFSLGLVWFLHPPFGEQTTVLRLVRLAGLDFVLYADHVQDFTPKSIWDRRLGYWCTSPSPHEYLEVFTALGRLAGSAGRLQLGVGVADVLRRHPITLAQAALTVAQLSKKPFILGLGAGERENTEPYGLDPAPRARRLEEAAAWIRCAFTSEGPFDFRGEYFKADGAVLDLHAPGGRTPKIWIAGHGPRMLEVVGRQGDGWLPIEVRDPADYEQCLRSVRLAAASAGRPPEAITPVSS